MTVTYLWMTVTYLWMTVTYLWMTVTYLWMTVTWESGGRAAPGMPCHFDRQVANISSSQDVPSSKRCSGMMQCSQLMQGRPACLTPRPPILIGRDACSHCSSVRSQLVRWLIVDLSNLSKSANAVLSTDGEQRMRCYTLCALKEACNSIIISSSSSSTPRK